jgi:hypothetical protein
VPAGFDWDVSESNFQYRGGNLLSEIQKTNSDANSREFKRGVEAGLDSEVTRFWEAGYELGHELNESAALEHVKETTQREPDAPLFLADTLDGHKGDAQDEKDETAE